MPSVYPVKTVCRPTWWDPLVALAYSLIRVGIVVASRAPPMAPMRQYASSRGEEVDPVRALVSKGTA